MLWSIFYFSPVVHSISFYHGVIASFFTSFQNLSFLALAKSRPCVFYRTRYSTLLQLWQVFCFTIWIRFLSSHTWNQKKTSFMFLGTLFTQISETQKDITCSGTPSSNLQSDCWTGLKSYRLSWIYNHTSDHSSRAWILSFHLRMLQASSEERCFGERICHRS